MDPSMIDGDIHIQLKTAEARLVKRCLWESELARVLLIDWLPEDVSEFDLYDIINPIGEVDDIVMMEHYALVGDIAIVKMATVEAAHTVIRRLHMVPFGGRRLNITLMSRKQHMLVSRYFLQESQLHELCDFRAVDEGYRQSATMVPLSAAGAKQDTHVVVAARKPTAKVVEEVRTVPKRFETRPQHESEDEEEDAEANESDEEPEDEDQAPPKRKVQLPKPAAEDSDSFGRRKFVPYTEPPRTSGKGGVSPARQHPSAEKPRQAAWGADRSGNDRRPKPPPREAWNQEEDAKPYSGSTPSGRFGARLQTRTAKPAPKSIKWNTWNEETQEEKEQEWENDGEEHQDWSEEQQKEESYGYTKYSRY